MFKPDATHPQYDEMVSVWGMCRDATTGQRAIRKGKEKYLPRLSEQLDDEYKNYLERALYFNATGRTAEALAGLVFRKDPTVDAPGIEELLGDVTNTGKSLFDLARDIVGDIIVVGRFGILVDYPPAPQTNAPVSVAQARQLSLRPYMTPYKAERILNWQYARFGNVTKLARVFLKEDWEGGEQVRELSLLSGSYQQIVWKKPKDKDQWEAEPPIAPTKGGASLTEIPFYFIGGKESGGDVTDPPIEDLAYVNIAHFKNSADYENGLHIAGLPTPYVTGVDPTQMPTMNLGSSQAWALMDPNSKVGFLQCGAEGFASIKEAMSDKKDEMAALGARLIAPDKKAAEAAETASIRRGGESSVLANMAASISSKLSKALSFMSEWAGAGGKATIELNRDYIVTKMTAQELTAWVSAVQSGTVSSETFFDALKAGEMVAETLDYETEQARKEADGPALGTMNANGQ